MAAMTLIALRVVVLARALSRRTEKGKHYGVVTAKFVAVLEALLWGFHNAASGRCFSEPGRTFVKVLRALLKDRKNTALLDSKKSYQLRRALS
jgi:hypothetical protein